MKIKDLSSLANLKEDVLSKFIEEPEHVNLDFDNSLFKNQLDLLGKKLNKTPPMADTKELNQIKRLYQSLLKIDEWFRKYNYTDKYPENVITRTTKLIQVKTVVQEKRLIDERFSVKVEGSGIFSIVDVYIIPYMMIDQHFKTSIECFRYVSLMTGYQLNGQFSNPMNLPEDGLYGSARELSETHFVIIAGKQENPLIKYVHRNIHWRYVGSNGHAL